MCIRLVVSPWPLKASLLYVLLEGDRLYPGGTRCSRHRWSGGTRFSVTDGPGGGGTIYPGDGRSGGTANEGDHQ